MAALNVTDVFCYICRSILIKPVTVPCKHKFCLNCFESSLSETSYSCPLCRRRLSSWIRSAKKENKLIDNQLWSNIQEQYKKEVAFKLSGKDDGLDERLQDEFPQPSRISNEGEVGEEFQCFIKAHEEELRLKREKEELQSLLLIRQINEEEAAKRLELQTSFIENKQSAKKMTKVVHRTYSNKSRGKSNQSNSQKIENGPMDNHIVKLFNKSHEENIDDAREPTDQRASSRTHSSDSIGTEMTHFKPIKAQPKTPPKDGSYIDTTIRKITPLKLFFDSNKLSSIKPKEQNLSIHSCYSAFRAPITSSEDDEVPRKKAKISDLPEKSVLKEINLDENSDSNSNFGAKSPDEVGLTKVAAPMTGEENVSGLEDINFILEEHRLAEEKLRQEKADKELAEKLNKEWNTVGFREYELRTCRPRRCPERQTTLLGTVVRSKK